MRRLPWFLVILTALLACAPPAAERPNIVWIVSEDQSDHYGPYGETLAKTPNIDRMAAEGAVFTRAFVTAPVCSPSRSALITGMYQTTIGAHNHRSGRGVVKILLPGEVAPVPALLRQAGYFVSNGDFRDPGEPVEGKTDYNFQFDQDLYQPVAKVITAFDRPCIPADGVAIRAHTPGMHPNRALSGGRRNGLGARGTFTTDCYDGADWAGRAGGQPFFAQVQLRGGKRRNQRTPAPLEGVRTNGVSPEAVELPPYYPDHPALRTDWAQYLESIEHVDWEVGRILERLQREDVAGNTVVFFLTDHGVSHARGKQFLTEEGIKIPLIVRAPGRIDPGTVRRDLVAHIDVAASTLAFAGIRIPAWMEGRPLFGPDAEPRDYVVSARDRCDETVDRIRSVRTERYKYIRNFVPERPHLQPNRYKDGKAVIRALREMEAGGSLSPEGAAMFFQPRPEEELYDLESDPRELRNLAGEEEHGTTLASMRTTLASWIEETGDRGQVFETPEEYDSDMAVYLGGRAGPQQEILKRNIAGVAAWRKTRTDADP